MEKLVSSLLQGTPTALVIGVVFLWFVQPMGTRMDRMVDVMNREVIPAINELKKGKPLPGLDIKPLAELRQEVSKASAALEDQGQRVKAIQAGLESVVKNQEASAKDAREVRAALAANQQAAKTLSAKLESGIDETRAVALLSGVPGALAQGKTFKPGDVIMNPAWAASGHFVVTDAQTLNAAKGQMLKTYVEKLGLKPVGTPP